MLRRATRRVLGNAAAAIDRAATLAASVQTRGARRRSRSESLGHHERLSVLSEIASGYPPETDAEFFRPARLISPSERSARGPGDLAAVDLAWPSEYEPHLAELAPRYRRHPENGVAGARLFSAGAAPRPAVVLIHGYLGGNHNLEQRVWPVEYFMRRGFDVALFVLPYHGPRAPRARSGPPPFPSSDPRMTVEGFRHAMADLGDFTAWLRARGHPSVGVMGMSLGGYSTALAATIDADLSFAVPIIPLASVADFARDQGRLGRTPEQTQREHAALDAAHRVVSPLARAPRVPRERVLVVGAENDRITPLAHARRLARHFDARLDTWHGGHLLQLGRGDAFRKIARFLDELT